MLERLQSLLKTVNDSKSPPTSLMSHRFVTVRRGSPAARSGLIQPGDQLDAVEGRAVTGLQHRDLAQILRRAGNALRLSVTPRAQTEAADVDIDKNFAKGSRGRSKDESRFYTVDLERGPTGFGFSLRGGSEYNMGLYVLGLMEGGPAQRSNKMQVSDQLVEINGDSAAGMTHSQAVEQIRRGGHSIHLVLKKGNGYVPDYGPEGDCSSHPPSQEKEQEAVTMMTTPHSTHWGEGDNGRRRTRGTKPRSRGRRPPDLDLDLVEEETREEQKRRKLREEKRKMRKEEKRRWKMVETEEGDAKHCGSSAAPQQVAFSFLMPLDAAEDQRLSDSQSDDSQSGASTAQALDWRRAGVRLKEVPGPWLDPSPHKLMQVLTGRRPSERGRMGGLSL